MLTRSPRSFQSSSVYIKPSPSSCHFHTFSTRIPLVQGARSARDRRSMTITASVNVSGGKLSVRGRTVLSGVPDAVVSTSAAAGGPVDGVFLGVEFPDSASRHVLSLGTFRDLRFMASFRIKLWWMAQKMGSQGREIPVETQFMLVEVNGGGGEEETMYAVLLPLVEGAFRTSLQGNTNDELELCLESGDVDTRAANFSAVVFVGVASDPFAAVFGAVAAVKSHLKTFRLRAEKRLPGIVDYFGWCTWDAFYQEVSQDGVEAGLQSLTSAGTPPKFVIIDDGWQSVASAQTTEKTSLQRLVGIKENNKFQSADDPAAGIRTIVGTAKEKYGLKYVYVWHAITGYWGGVQPGVEGMEQFGSKIRYPNVSPGVVENEPGLRTDALTLQGIGLVDPKNVHLFYKEQHKYLAAAGVDGVKVDVQCMLETLGSGIGGRVELTKTYHKALDESVAKNFPDNGCIACMSHNTDALYCSKQTAVVRASDDFYPRDPMSHTIHIAAVAYNSVFLGEFMLPDWDMFHSLHPAAEYHASARAISGGPVYVSDAPGNHDLELLRKLVLPDGSILRAQLPGRPTIDCLFSDPTRDGKSLLKIWNMNKFTGVLGVYNCQGAAWCLTEKKNVPLDKPGALSYGVKASDIHFISDASTDPDWDGDCAVYRHRNGEIVVLPRNAVITVSLEILEHEVFTVTPIKALPATFRFAPFGLVDMYNAGGAITSLSYTNRGTDSGVVCMEVKGCGRFGAYSSMKPKKCMLGLVEVEFSYEPTTGFLSLLLETMPVSDEGVHRVTVEV